MLLAQGTAFTYQGRLQENGSPANGAYDLQFSIYGAETGGSPLAGPLAKPMVPVSNGLFTVTLDFGANVFNGGPRWLEAEVVQPGLGAPITLSPRQAITATPYAIQALSASSVPAGTITSSMLAPGSAPANLLASGVSGVGQGGVVLSELEFASNLFSQGYVRLGKTDLVSESWRTLTNGPPLGALQVLSRKDFAAVWTGSEMFVWGGQDSTGALNTGGRYNPASDTWTPMTTSNAPSPQIAPVAAWNGTHLIVWGSSGPVRGGRYNPVTDTWLPLSETNAPGARANHSAIWTGTYLIIWAGTEGGLFVNTGARYDPVGNVWSSTSAAGAPAIRDRHSAIWTGSEMIVWGGRETHSCGFLCSTTTNYTDGARYNPSSNTWQPMTTVNAPLKRYAHSAVWTGSEMIVWGGRHGEGTFAAGTNINTGARYNPALNQWTAAASSVGAPAGRESHAAYWTGSRMLIWGGSSTALGNLTDGALYNPANDTWTAINSGGAPPARIGFGTAWTGSELLVWGGGDADQGTYSEFGFRYNAAGNGWATMSPGGDPSARNDATAVWAETEMLGWGGRGREYALRSGGRLNPSQPPATMWSNIGMTNTPGARAGHTAVWTGTEMIVWGGFNGAQPLNTGGRYAPSLNTWTSVTTAGAPGVRGRHVAVWTGTQMIIWGGFDGTNYLATGGRHNPAANTWQSVSAVNAPSARADATAVWTGSEMIVWGGQSVAGGAADYLNTGSRYDPVSNTWQPLPASGAPTARSIHTAVWTGSEMLIWGGLTQTGPTRTGARLQLFANQWLPLPEGTAPASRTRHTAVWAGTQMIVWGGFDGTNELSSGARYDPVRDLWFATTSTNAPSARQRHTAVWSGTEMIIWSGRRFNGVQDVFYDDAYGYTPLRTVYLYLRP